MEKLIELLNEYEVEKKPSRLQRNYYLGFVHNFGKGIMYIDEEGEDVDDYKTDYEIINKEYGFIKWLVSKEQRRIDRSKVNFDDIFYHYDAEITDEERILILLSIQEKPVELLISLLK